MLNIKQWLHRHPLLGTMLCVTLAVGLLKALPYAAEGTPLSPDFVSSLVRYSVSVLLVILMLKFGWAKDAGITLRIGAWRKRWWLVTVPMLLIGILNLVGSDWSEANFTFSNTALWLADNFGVGLFEETLLRGVCFYILFQAWQHQPGGIYKAAVTQGLIFGLLHLMNLDSNPVQDTIIQVVYATLLGVGFAGLTAYTRSIWPGIFVHTFINLMGSADALMDAAPTQTPGDLSGYMVAIVLITLLSTLPGIWCLHRAQRTNVG